MLSFILIALVVSVNATPLDDDRSDAFEECIDPCYAILDIAESFECEDQCLKAHGFFTEMNRQSNEPTGYGKFKVTASLRG